MPNHTMRCLAGLAAMYLLGGCASSGGTGTDGPLEAPDRFTIFYRADAAETDTELVVGIDRAWEVLPSVFRDLGFPSAPASNTTDRVMMTPHLQVRGELYPGELTSDYLNCGSSRSSGARADFYDVTFIIMTRLTPIDEGRVKVQTIVDGHARDPMASGGSVPCNSTGKFEEQLSALLWRRARTASR